MLLQKRAMRVITCSRYNAHTEPLFKKLNLLKVQDFKELNVLKMYYKYKNGELPLYMTEMFSNYSRAHSYDTHLTRPWMNQVHSPPVVNFVFGITCQKL